MEAELVQMLRCPATLSPLSELDGRQLVELNLAILRGEVVNQTGAAIDRPLDGALLNASGSLIYAVWNEIPSMLADEAIPAATLACLGAKA